MRFIPAAIVLLLCLNLGAQQPGNYTFRHLNQTDGLLHTTIKSMVQDNRGYVWILSVNGLQRYDGTRFVNYPFNFITDNRTSDIKDISLLFADSTNNCLWLMGTEIEKLDLDKNRFSLYNTERMITDSIFKFSAYQDASGNPWLAGNYGILTRGTNEKIMRPYYLTATSLNGANRQVYADTANGETWIADWNGLKLFDAKTKKVYTHNYNPLRHPLLLQMNKLNLTAIMKDSDQNVWIGSGSKYFYRYNSVNKKLAVYSIGEIENSSKRKVPDDQVVIVNCFFEDNHQNVWIGTVNAGLLKYNRHSDTFTYTLNNARDRQGLHYNYEITSIFQDKEENIWLGTDKGISIFNPFQQSFKTIRHQENNPASIAENEINGFIQAANGDVLLGTWGGGISIYDSNLQFKKNIRLPGHYEYNLVWSFVQNDDGNIWAGCQHGYIHVYDPEKGVIKTLHPPELHNSTIWDIKKDKAGNIYFALHDGTIARWNKLQNKFYAYNDVESNKDQVPSRPVNIFFDSKENCWVTTTKGLRKFDTKKGCYSAVYLPDKKNPFAISAFDCSGIEQYNDSILLIGTAYGGLNFFNINSKNFTHTTVANGLPGNTIHSIKKDAAGFIWFTTDFDLYKFKPDTAKFIRYNIEPGTINAEFKNTSFYPLKNGSWLTATSAEIIAFKPINKQVSMISQQLPAITGLKVFDTVLPLDSLLNAGKPVILTFQQNFLTIEFSLPVFSSQLQTDYYYKLEGVDYDWVQAGTKRFASYTNLGDGKYTFYIRTKNGDAIAQSNPLNIIITPPFWKTWWFILLTILAAGLLIYWFIKWRIQNIRDVEAAKLTLQQLNAEQYKAKLEMEQIVNYFSSSLIDKNTVDEVLWDVAKNLIGRLGFEDCMIYLWNSDKTKMIQRAGYGPKGSIEEIEKNVFTVTAGQGVVGHVMQTRQPLLIPDTAKDHRYRIDEMERQSEITVPIIYDNELVGVIDSEHQQKNFFTQQHIQVLSTIATLMANKIKSIESAQSLQLAKIEMLEINEKLTAAKLEALRSQMNPHFIFNCLNSIDNLIQSSEKEKATLYLSKFAKLIRSVLETSKINTVPCWKDMETLKLYIELEEFRWDKKFTYELNIAEEIFSGDYKVPPLVIQPFVENAIHHGLLNKIDPDKKLSISVSGSENYIYYTIADNGVGRKKAALYKELNRPSHESMGMQITTDRINLFNQHQNGAVQITDLLNEQGECIGTSVAVTLINQS